ncbi:MAG: hypothetical protein IMZ50_16440 [Candidatus Atribacteria bacterium]|nr:hypothetical protein [Candidatus Atribacteria bacterium]
MTKLDALKGAERKLQEMATDCPRGATLQAWLVAHEARVAEERRLAEKGAK